MEVGRIMVFKLSLTAITPMLGSLKGSDVLFEQSYSNNIANGIYYGVIIIGFTLRLLICSELFTYDHFS